MSYSIGELAKKLNLAPSTIRYYDKEGLFPHIKRKSSGIRVFSEKDLDMLQIIECLKIAGLSIKDIKAFIDLTQKGDASLKERYELFMERKKAVENEIQILTQALDTINFKCWYYKTALEAGTENIHAGLEARKLSELIYLKGQEHQSD